MKKTKVSRDARRPWHNKRMGANGASVMGSPPANVVKMTDWCAPRVAERRPSSNNCLEGERSPSLTSVATSKRMLI